MKRSQNHNFRTAAPEVFRIKPGLNKKVVQQISQRKAEPVWMRDFRLAAYDKFRKKKMPSWGADIGSIDFNSITYYLQPQDRPQQNWEDVPQSIKETFEKLGIPQAERAFLAGTGAQFESEVVYHSLHESLARQGVIFESMDQGLKKYPDLVKKYFGTIIPSSDNAFAALNSAVWSGGSFVYVPKGVHVTLPLQAYFRINAERMGQFERTLIIADEGSSVHYIEGCTAPTYSSDSLHSAVVEVIVHRGARVQYTTIQNWSSNVYNLVTKRAVVWGNGEMIWVDCNLGSKVTMKYPCVILREKGAKGEIHSFAAAATGQHQDAGAKAIHLAPDTSSTIISRSLSKQGGRASYRGLVKIMPGAVRSRSRVVCDALLLDGASQSDTYPTMDIREQTARVVHEASVKRLGEQELFYLQSRGIGEREAASLLLNGFALPIVKKLPMEYALEMHRLLDIEFGARIA
ncbi:MAG: Fe-S cluster assembly protein SufB [Patescibacteria group bacterium]